MCQKDDDKPKEKGWQDDNSERLSLFIYKFFNNNSAHKNYYCYCCYY